MDCQLPPPGAVPRILVWHQGALGDLLLALPALTAVCRRYPEAHLTGLGQPERWGLLSRTLPLEAVYDGDEAVWAWLFAGEAPLPPALRELLGPFQLALVFSPRPRLELLTRLGQGGIPAVIWIPAFPEGGREPVAALQARRLAGLGLAYRPATVRLRVDARDFPLEGLEPYLALAPGSGNPLKNWPLSHYYEAARALARQEGLKVVWLLGPAEADWLPYLTPLAQAQGQVVLDRLPLAQVAAVLARARLYLGGDSGLSHLAACAGARAVLVLFGPTDPQVWAPPGKHVTVLTPEHPCAPCTSGREISCAEPRCLKDLPPERVVQAAARLLQK